LEELEARAQAIQRVGVLEGTPFRYRSTRRGSRWGGGRGTRPGGSTTGGSASALARAAREPVTQRAHHRPC
jgi:hypothetical protein